MDTEGSDARAGVGETRTPGSAPLAIGPLILARSETAASALARRTGDAPRREFVALYFPIGDGTPSGEAFLSEDLVPPPALGARLCIALLAPQRFLAGVLPAESRSERLAPSAGLRVLRRYLDGLLELDEARLCEGQRALAANAVRSLLAAALSAVDPAADGLGSRRREALADRVTAYVDAHLHDELHAGVLCSALGCSRSALYRATAEAGGAAELILNRRLLAIGERLRDVDESRAIAAIAGAYGFPDLVQFNRRFKALFGAPPSQLRRPRNSGGPPRPNPRPRPLGPARQPKRRSSCR